MGGKWTTTNSAADRSAGRSAASLMSASTPPEEAPTTTILRLDKECSRKREYNRVAGSPLISFYDHAVYPWPAECACARLRNAKVSGLMLPVAALIIHRCRSRLWWPRSTFGGATTLG